MRKHQFTKRDRDSAVVFSGFDGRSYSATVVEVTPDTVRIRYFPDAPIPRYGGGWYVRPAYAVIPRAEWHRLTRFPTSSKFFVL